MNSENPVIISVNACSFNFNFSASSGRTRLLREAWLGGAVSAVHDDSGKVQLEGSPAQQADWTTPVRFTVECTKLAWGQTNYSIHCGFAPIFGMLRFSIWQHAVSFSPFKIP